MYHNIHSTLMSSKPDQEDALDDIRAMRDTVRILAQRARQHRSYLLRSAEISPLPPLPAGVAYSHSPAAGSDPSDITDHLTGPCPVDLPPASED